MVGPSTNDVHRRAQIALTSSPVYVLREIHVERVGDSLLLSGQVDSFYHKQLAQELVREVAEDLKVVNTVDVQ